MATAVPTFTRRCVPLMTGADALLQVHLASITAAVRPPEKAGLVRRCPDLSDGQPSSLRSPAGRWTQAT
jgi:hypothetical protein